MDGLEDTKKSSNQFVDSYVRQFADLMVLKICGITRLPDALHATQQGATALGFVFWPRSPRYVAPERAAEITAALPAAVTKVGVFVNEPADRIRTIVAAAHLDVVQLHGDEQPLDGAVLDCPLFRSATIDDAEEIMAVWPVGTPLLLDAADRDRRGGTGTTVDWSRAAALARRRRIILAGGLSPENVSDAIAAVNPYGVDVSSGVEDAPGVKNGAKVTRFLANARAAFERRAK
jgi:phosphoribosylanthranilate isomerase